MTLRALIVDDEPPARRRLRALLKAEPVVEVIGEATDGQAAVRAIEQHRPDLVFLDVQMPGLSGFDVLAAVAKARAGSLPAVIFVTAYDQYALQAFDVHAIDYLLKPFDRARLHRAIERASRLAGGAELQARLLALVGDSARHKALRRLVVRSGGRIYFVDAEDIDWIEAAGHYVSLHVGKDTHLIRETIGGLASRLDRERFVQIHRGALVNLDRIKELRPSFHGECDVILKDGTRLHATRTYAAAIK